jgi:hypothetical protein
MKKVNQKKKDELRTEYRIEDFPKRFIRGSDIGKSECRSVMERIRVQDLPDPKGGTRPAGGPLRENFTSGLLLSNFCPNLKENLLRWESK